MTRKLITFAVSVVLAAEFAAGTPRSCNKTDGCAWEHVYENQRMMENGLMTKGMEEGRANKKAFEDLREWERTHGAAPSNLR